MSSSSPALTAGAGAGSRAKFGVGTFVVGCAGAVEPDIAVPSAAPKPAPAAPRRRGWASGHAAAAMAAAFRAEAASPRSARAAPRDAAPRPAPGDAAPGGRLLAGRPPGGRLGRRNQRIERQRPVEHRQLGLRRSSGARAAAHDIGLDHDVGCAADHDQMLDIVAPDQHELPLPVEIVRYRRCRAAAGACGRRPARAAAAVRPGSGARTARAAREARG